MKKRKKEASLSKKGKEKKAEASPEQKVKKKTDSKPCLKMDRKNVASRAYHRKFTEMLKSLTREEAKVYAREAHQRALDLWDQEHQTAK